MRGRTVIVVAVSAAVLLAVAAGLAVWRANRSTEQVLLPANSMWRFDDSGTDQGIGWRQADFDDSDWQQGQAPFGYGQAVTTTIGFGGNDADKNITAYFRTSFEVPEGTQGLQLEIRRDDGAAVYLNGTEVLRTGLPDGDITAGTKARFAQNNGDSWVVAELPATTVAPGTNTVAVEVHQSEPDSSDLFFDLRITGLPEAPQGGGPVPAGATRVTAAGDIGECGGAAPEVGELLEGIPGPFLALGDIAYPNGAPGDYRECYDPYFGPAKDRTVPVPGNHDYMTDGAKPYFDYFGSTVGTPQDPWYSRDIGAWHVVLLNSNCADVGGCDEQSRQYQWLKRDLAAHSTSCLAAVWHHPRYSSSEYGDNTEVAPLFQALVDAGGDLVLNGHAHFYERYPRMNNEGAADDRGMREFIVGTGGANLYQFEAVNPASQVRWNQGHGLLELDLKAEGYDWRYVPTDTSVKVDSGSDTC